MNRYWQMLVVLIVVNGFSVIYAAQENSLQSKKEVPAISNEFLGFARHATIDEQCQRLNILANLLLFQEVALKIADEVCKAFNGQSAAMKQIFNCFPNSKKSLRGKLIACEMKLDPAFVTIEGLIVLMNYRDKILGLKLSEEDEQLAQELLSSTNEDCVRAGQLIKVKLMGFLAHQKYFRFTAVLSGLCNRMDADTLHLFDKCQAYRFISFFVIFATKMFQLIELNNNIPDMCQEVPESYWKAFFAARDLFTKEMPALYESYKNIREECLELYTKVKIQILHKAHGNARKYLKQYYVPCRLLMPNGTFKMVSEKEWQLILASLQPLPSNLESAIYTDVITADIDKIIDPLNENVFESYHDELMKTNAIFKPENISEVKQLLKKMGVEEAAALRKAQSLSSVHESSTLQVKTSSKASSKPLTSDLSSNATPDHLGCPATLKANSVNHEIGDEVISCTTTDKSDKKLVQAVRQKKAARKGAKKSATRELKGKTQSCLDVAEEHCHLNDNQPIVDQTPSQCCQEPGLQNSDLRIDHHDVCPDQQSTQEISRQKKATNSEKQLVKKSKDSSALSPKTERSDGPNRLGKKKIACADLSSTTPIMMKQNGDYVLSETCKPHVVTIADTRHQILLTLYLPLIKAERQYVDWNRHTDMIKLWNSSPKEALFISGETDPGSSRYRDYYSDALPLRDSKSLQRICMIHNFSKLVDSYMKQYGILQSHTSLKTNRPDYALVLPGHVTYDNGQGVNEECIFTYLIDGNLCYHRNIDFRSKAQLSEEFFCQGKFAINEDA